MEDRWRNSIKQLIEPTRKPWYASHSQTLDLQLSHVFLFPLIEHKNIETKTMKQKTVVVE